MLNEPASSANGHGRVYETPEAERFLSVPPAEPPRLMQVRDLVADVLAVERERVLDDEPVGKQPGLDPVLMNPSTPVLMAFEGRLLYDAEAAYERLDSPLKALDLFAAFREEAGKHVVYIVQGRVDPPPRSWWPNLLLLLATIVSVLIMGTVQAASELAISDMRQAAAIMNDIWANLWRGIPYAASVILILGAHELGHYFAARRHKVAVTLPYFLPFPYPLSLFGTLGAFIQLRQPIRNRKILLDIGAAGPLAGLVFAVPILLIGLATSPRLPLQSSGYQEGNSILYALAKFLVFGEFLPSAQADVYVNQLAWAGWIGLFVTGLNLIPVGQLDGGHVMYSLFGDRARMLYLPSIAALTILTILTEGALILILLLLLFLGRAYAVPLDNITQLDPRRRRIALGTLAVFVLVFVPVPLRFYTLETAPLPPGLSALLPVAAVWMQVALRALLARRRV